MNIVVEEFINDFLSGKVNYRKYSKIKSEILEDAPNILKELKGLLNSYKENDLIIPYIILLAIAEYKEAYPLIVKCFNMSESKEEILLGDAIFEIIPYAVELTFDGDFDPIVTVLTNKRSNISKASLFDSFINLCVKNDNHDMIKEFVDVYYKKDLFEGFHDSILDSMISYKLDYLFPYVKELQTEHKLDFMIVGPYFEAIRQYFVFDKEIVEDPIKAMFVHMGNFVDVTYKPKLAEYNHFDEYEKDELIAEDLKKYLINNPYNGDYEDYKNDLLANINLIRLYPEEKVKEKYPKACIELDSDIYCFMFIERVVYTNSELESYQAFVDEYYNDVTDKLEDYLKSNNVSYLDFDKDCAIHFVTSDLYVD